MGDEEVLEKIRGGWHLSLTPPSAGSQRVTAEGYDERGLPQHLLQFRGEYIGHAQDRERIVGWDVHEWRWREPVAGHQVHVLHGHADPQRCLRR